ncbi:hypothetical protein OOZ63_27090 [Paucibacter sp. PLA-PC-4]|uniref:hypothetical protein n=1 Tax=Paucibacter sp. PLA-PC-4 TaxID=2993655 RepID=UPI00224B7E7E|nr:hypothetical protein [Paucibacter sp. PLA-PC-4]MCX2865493.1 hypothetical protein [Paucibacter sp. PLA-PC-4]
MPVARCSAASRSDCVYFETTRSLKPIDALPAWAMSCLFVAADQCRKGLARQMVVAAAEHALRHGAPVLQAQPVDGSGATAEPTFDLDRAAGTVRAGRLAARPGRQINWRPPPLPALA